MKTYKLKAILILIILLFINISINSCTVKNTDINRQNDLAINQKKVIDDIENHRINGNSYYEKSEYQRAEDEFKSFLKYKPDNPEINYKLGVIFNKKGKVRESILQFLKVLTIDEYYTNAYFNLGIIYASEGPHFDPEKASFFFNKYLILAPDSEHKEKIEAWISSHAGIKVDNTWEDKTTSPGYHKERDEDFKIWVKEKIDQLNEDK